MQTGTVGISGLVLLIMELFQTNFVDKIIKYILCIKIFFFETRAVYEIMWENMVERDRPLMTT
jgi:hypothetical protein